MGPETTIAVILFLFIGAGASLLSALFLLMFIRKISIKWKSETNKKMPTSILRAGLIMISGPLNLLAYTASKIFILSNTPGVSIFEPVYTSIVLMLVGVYYTLMSASVFSILFHLETLIGKKNKD